MLAFPSVPALDVPPSASPTWSTSAPHAQSFAPNAESRGNAVRPSAHRAGTSSRNIAIDAGSTQRNSVLTPWSVRSC